MDFCPGCGKKSKGICSDCRPSQEIKYKDISIKICSGCKKVFVNNKWSIYHNLEEPILKTARQKIKETGFEMSVEVPEIKYNPGIRAEALITLVKSDEEFTIPCTVDITICPSCKKARNEYLEGVLQLRNVDEKLIASVKEFAANNNIHITKIDRMKSGYDLNVSDHKKIQNLGSMLQKTYGGVLKVSPQLFSHNNQTSKDIYRVNVFYDMPEYRKGDGIVINNKTYLITGVTKNISCIDMSSGKNTTLFPKEKEFRVIKPQTATITRIHPHIEVLDPETYQSVAAQNQKNVKVGETVQIINNNGIIYLI